jgi:hypothetical protein
MIVTDEEGLAGMDWNEEEGASLLAARREYDCVICSQTTTSTEDKPMGLAVLVQVSIAQYVYYLLQVSESVDKVTCVQIIIYILSIIILPGTRLRACYILHQGFSDFQDLGPHSPFLLNSQATGL